MSFPMTITDLRTLEPKETIIYKFKKFLRKIIYWILDVKSSFDFLYIPQFGELAALDRIPRNFFSQFYDQKKQVQFLEKDLFEIKEKFNLLEEKIRFFNNKNDIFSVIGSNYIINKNGVERQFGAGFSELAMKRGESYLVVSDIIDSIIDKKPNMVIKDILEVTDKTICLGRLDKIDYNKALVEVLKIYE